MNKDMLVEIETAARKRYDEAKKFFDMNFWKSYNYYYNLYNSVRRKGNNAAGWRSNAFLPVIFAQVNTEVPRYMDGLFGSDGTKFYSWQPDEESDENIKILEASAEAITRIQNLHKQEGGYYNVNFLTSLSAHIYGISWTKQTWDYREEKREYTSVREGKPKQVPYERTIDRPKWESKNAFDCWWDPNATSRADMTYLVERQFMHLSQFKEQAEYWNITKNFNKVMELATNEAEQQGLVDDPVIEVITVYTKKDITSLVFNIAVRHQDNPFAHGNIPFYPMMRYPDHYKFQGKGIPAILSDLNESMNDLHNLMLDNIELGVNKILLKRKGGSLVVKDLNLQPGKVITLEDINADIKTLDLGGITFDSFKMMESLNGFVNQTAGSLDYLNAPSGIGAQNKTATGARIIVQEANRRFAFAIKYNKENYIVPMLKDELMLYRQYFDIRKAEKSIGKKATEQLNLEFKNIKWDGAYNPVISGNVSLIDKEARLENLEKGIPMLNQLGAVLDNETIAAEICDTLDINKKLVKGFAPPPQLGPDGKPVPPQGPPQEQPQAQPAPGQPNASEATQQPGQGPALDPQTMAELAEISKVLAIPVEGLVQDLNAGKVDMPTLRQMVEKKLQTA